MMCMYNSSIISSMVGHVDALFLVSRSSPTQRSIIQYKLTYCSEEHKSANMDRNLQIFNKTQNMVLNKFVWRRFHFKFWERFRFSKIWWTRCFIRCPMKPSPSTNRYVWLFGSHLNSIPGTVIVGIIGMESFLQNSIGTYFEHSFRLSWISCICSESL